MLCDFVEFFLQIFEYWVSQLQVFVYYVKYYQFGELMLQVLCDNMLCVVIFNKGYDMSELLVVVLFDMWWYSLLILVLLEEVDVFEQLVFWEENLDLVVVFLCYCSSYFFYIFGGGYVVGYYVYLWIQMLVDDGY